MAVITSLILFFFGLKCYKTTSPGKFFLVFFVILYCLYYVKSAPKDVMRFVVLIVRIRITLKLLRQNLLKNDVLRLVKRGFETEFDVNND